MALAPYNHEFIEVEVQDRVIGGTIIKQKAIFNRMDILQNQYTGAVNVTVWVRVNLFANVAGAYGDKLDGKGLSSYDITLTADNNSAVDPTTGAIKFIRFTETDEQWKTMLESKVEPLMLQGDFFEYLMNYAPVEIAPMLRNFIVQANSAPFNKFA